MEYKIGQKFWRHDENYRHYTNDDGTKSISPIYIKSFREWYLVGMTSRSYLLSYFENPPEWAIKNAFKVPKKDNLENWGFLDSWEKVEDNVWVHNNQYRILENVKFSKLSRKQLEDIERIINGKI